MTDQPRWPEGTPVAPGGKGPGGGRFRDTGAGGDWAERISAGIPVPAAGYSWGTRVRTQALCHLCGKRVSEVGHGKLATHNSWPGERCPGSGLSIDLTATEAYDAVLEKRRQPPKQRQPHQAGRVQAKPRPTVDMSQPLDHDSNPEAVARMDAWDEDRHYVPAFRRQLPQELKIKMRAFEDANNDLQRERSRVHGEVRDARRVPGRNWIDMDGWEEDLATDRRYLAAAVRQEDALRNLRAAMDAFRGNPPSHPDRPLSVYGDDLHVDGYGWHVYQALDQLEQQVPPVFHQIAADYIAADPVRGIWLGESKNLTQLDRLSSRLVGKPRGWSKGSTWEEPDGVVTGDGRMAVAFTANAEGLARSAKQTRRRVYGAEVADAMPPPPSPTTLHEMGHLLDQAIGHRRDAYRVGDASEQRLFRLLHGKVKRESTRLSPYFRQRGDAGPSEFFADAFGTWASYPDEEMVDPDTGRPRFALAAGQRPVTARDVAIGETYGVSNKLAQEISDYFIRLQTELESGRRRPAVVLLAENLITRRTT